MFQNRAGRKERWLPKQTANINTHATVVLGGPDLCLPAGGEGEGWQKAGIKWIAGKKNASLILKWAEVDLKSMEECSAHKNIKIHRNNLLLYFAVLYCIFAFFLFNIPFGRGFVCWRKLKISSVMFWKDWLLEWEGYKIQRHPLWVFMKPLLEKMPI